MFGRKKKTEEKIQTYDASRLRPVIKSSICTGEQVAGFVDKESGKFQDIMLIRGETDLHSFCKIYGLKEEEIEKIW